jgi:hypothetical protein
MEDHVHVVQVSFGKVEVFLDGVIFVRNMTAFS